MEETFVQTKYGYCFYDLDNKLIYNLYIHPEYRRQGNARKLLQHVLNEIRWSGYTGAIEIEAIPKEDSIDCEKLIKFYKTFNLKIKERKNGN